MQPQTQGYLLAFLLLGSLLVHGAVADHSQPPFPIHDADWRTDFRRHTVPLEEVVAGGPPRDGIPPLDKPHFVPFAAADAWLEGQEPVVALSRHDEAKAYPLQILIWHEIVNDTVGGEPLTVTFCPLCNSAIAFKRHLDSRVLDFGTTGRLRHSDLIMWDRQTESWWQQLTGEAIIGALAGKRLDMVPASIVSYTAFKETYPEGVVLSRHTGYHRAYGQNPYQGYDRLDNTPFLYRGPADPRLPPMERVVAVSFAGEDRAYPYRVLAEKRVVTDTVGGQRLVILYSPGTVSALDQSSISRSRDVGATGVFIPRLDGRPLTLVARGEDVVDLETQSTWNVLGKATTGPLAGRTLQPVLHADHFAFAWLVFKPKTQIYSP